MRRRLKPYTALGIRRVPCLRCGRPSQQQWNACALGNAYFGVCNACDVGLNELVLQYFRVPGARRMLRLYRRRLADAYGENGETGEV